MTGVALFRPDHQFPSIEFDTVELVTSTPSSGGVVVLDNGETSGRSVWFGWGVHV